MDIQQWLNEPPQESDIMFTDNKYPYLPTNVVKRLLKEYCDLLGDGYSWGDKNFSCQYHSFDGITMVTGSIELNIYHNGVIIRTFTGSSTSSLISFREQNIDQFGGSINSMALSFAAKKLGNKFCADELVAIDLNEGGKIFGKSSDGEFDVFVKELKKKDKKTALSFYSSSKIEFTDDEKKEISSIIKQLK